MSYAKALFALAKQRNQTELVGRELGGLAATFESDVDLRDFFARPWTSATLKRTVAMEVAQRSGLSKIDIEAIAEKYRKLLDENLGRVRASARTTVPLTDEERQMLSTKIGEVRRSRQVVLEEIVDPTMLGGLIVESGGVVLDGSLEGQLARMRHRLASG